MNVAEHSLHQHLQIMFHPTQQHYLFFLVQFCKRSVDILIYFRKQYLHGKNGQLEIRGLGGEYLDQCVDLTPSMYLVLD